MSYSDKTFKELEAHLNKLVGGDKSDLETIKDILLEHIEFIDEKLTELCEHCGGSGEVETLIEYGGREIEKTFICKYCNGTGYK